MAKQLLDDFYVFSTRLQDRRGGVPKRVPSDLSRDPCRLEGGPDKRLDLLHIQHDRYPLPLGALTRLRNRVPIVPFPADRVIENCMHEVSYLCLTAKKKPKANKPTLIRTSTQASPKAAPEKGGNTQKESRSLTEGRESNRLPLYAAIISGAGETPSVSPVPSFRFSRHAPVGARCWAVPP